MHPSLIARIHAYVRGERPARPSNADAPKGLHKEYARMERIVLPAPAALSLSLDEAFAARSSYERCGDGRPFTLKEAGALLGNALGLRDELRRRYPSGGALYPVETYLVGEVLKGHPRGVYHYHPKAHALEYLWPIADDFSAGNLILDPATFAPILLVFTSVWERSGGKYGDLAYSHSLLEAGHMAQNVLLAAAALGIQARPISGFDDRAVSKLLDLDERTEQAIYSIGLCSAE